MADLRDLLDRVWSDLVARPAGPLHFRFLVQPLVAGTLAIRDGIRDAREGRSPYLWDIATDAKRRRSRLGEGVAATGKIVVLAVLLDAVYQVMVLRAFYPGEALLVAVVLGFVPYLILRGPAGRIARRWIKPTPADREASAVPKDDAASSAR
jgi:hypothetical protein